MYKKRRYLLPYHTKIKLGKSINTVLAAIILLTLLFPAGFVQAAESDTHLIGATGRCAAPDRSGNPGGSLFLPFVLNLFNGLRYQTAEFSSESAEFSDVASATTDLAVLNAHQNWSSRQVPRQLGYEVGKTYVYLYDYALEAKNLGRSRDGTETAEGQVMRLNTYVDMTVISQNSDASFAMELSMRDPFICTSDNLEEQTVLTDQATIDALAAPLRFDQSGDGTVSNVRTLPDAPVIVKNLQKGVINFIQVTLQPSGDQYIAAEQGIQGTYNANYQLEEKSDGVHITKTITQNDLTEVVSIGDKPDSFEMGLTYNIVLDGEQNVLSSIALAEQSTSADGSKDPATNEGAGMDGLSVWSTSEATGSMVLEEVVNAPTGRSAKSIEALYQADIISGDLSEERPDQNGIDLSDVDLAAEFATYEADPDNPNHFVRIMELARAEGGDAVTDEIGKRMAQNVTNPDLMNDYIDMLGEIGTPLAQEYLNGIFNNAQARSANIMASTTITNQEQALYNMVILSEPVTQTVGTLRTLSNDDDSELKSTATKALSVAANELDDEALLEEILAELSVELDEAADVDELLDTLYAIGNLGLESSLDTLTQYITGTLEISGTVLTDTYDILDINATAYEAMVDIPGIAAEDILLDALEDDTLDDWVWEIVVDVLLDRDVYEDTALTDEAWEILESFLDGWYDEEEPGLPRNGMAINGELKRSWNWAMGGEKAGVRLPGSIIVASPPESDKYGGGLYLMAQQQVNAYIWELTDNYNVASASVRSVKSGDNQNFQVKVSLANHAITAVDINETISCNSEVQKRLLDKKFDIFSLTFIFFTPVGVTLNFQIAAGGQITLDLIAGANICAGTNPSISGGIAPGAAIVITGRVFISVFLARAGAEVQGFLMHTSVPIVATVSLLNSDPGVQVCLDIKTVTRPFSVDFNVFAEVWVIDKWKGKSWTLFSYSVDKTWEHPLLKYCNPEPNGSERFLDAMNGGVTFFSFAADANCGNSYPGFWAGRQLLNTHWQPDNVGSQTVSICRGSTFPSNSVTYLVRKNVSCPTGSSRLGFIQGSAFSNSSDAYNLDEAGMTMCLVTDPSVQIDDDANFYLTHNLVNCRAGDNLAGHIYPDKFSSAPPQWDHFGMTVCERD